VGGEVENRRFQKHDMVGGVAVVRTSIFGWRTFADLLRLICGDHFVGEVFNQANSAFCPSGIGK